jgi:hypothetical protein
MTTPPPLCRHCTAVHRDGRVPCVRCGGWCRPRKLRPSAMESDLDYVRKRKAETAGRRSYPEQER